ncbi:MAG TPA: hypothetical protein VFQ44_14895 [Streptosporangiaceae bacterium]|nr:hypothetical protein [Streptosporangiaceae bacterium]
MSYFSPERMPSLRPTRREAARLQLEQVVARSGRRWRLLFRGRRARLVTCFGVAAALMSTGAATFAAVSYQPVTNSAMARCYTIADLGGVSATVPVAGHAGSRKLARNALAVCKALYQQGWLRRGATKITKPAGAAEQHPVPRLVVCAIAGGLAAVFPGGPRVCAKLGLRPMLDDPDV